MNDKNRKNKRAVGGEKEFLAAEYLKQQGYVILDMNYRCRQGEVDIVARDGAYLVFVEVKYRKSAVCGAPAEAVDFRKQQRICYAARHYLMTKRLPSDQPVRFDVAAVMKDQIQIIQNAFYYME